MSSQTARISKKREIELINKRIHAIRSTYSQIIFITSGLVCLGLLALFSVSSAQLASQSKFPYSIILKQIAFVGVGLLAVAVIAWFVLPRASDKLMNYCILFFFLSTLALTSLTLFSPFSREAYGSKRWLSLFGISFQPSEFLKVALILFLASSLIQLGSRGGITRITNSSGNIQTERRGRIPFATLAIAIIASVGVVSLQPHLGMAFLIFFSALSALFLANLPIKSILKFLLFVFILGALTYLAFPSKFEHAKARFRTFRNPTADVSGEGYQVIQSLGAISRAGFFGKGYMNSLQKFNRLPLADKDFIFAIWVEEMGLFGAIMVIFLFLYLLILCFRCALLLPFGFDSVAIASLGTLLVLQAMLNICANVSLIPVSGLALPFFSYGGSSMLSSLLIVGTILGLIRRRTNIGG